LISLGTPTIIVDPDFLVGTNGFAESGFLRRAFFSAQDRFQDRFDENGLVTARSAISNQETAIDLLSVQDLTSNAPPRLMSIIEITG
jgi:hypothetical protein